MDGFSLRLEHAPGLRVAVTGLFDTAWIVPPPRSPTSIVSLRGAG